MTTASYLQTNFLGGEWSPFAQGRADMEQYRTALNLCYNVIPLEVGAATRRPGTLFCATTRGGQQAALRTFHFSQAAPYSAEFTTGHLRLFAGQNLVLENEVSVAAISSADPAKVTTNVNVFATGDQVEFALSPINSASPAGVVPLFNRQYVATVIDDQHFTLTDPVTGANIDGSTFSLAGWTAKVARVLDFTTPYAAAEIQALRLVQNEDVAFILHNSHFPMALEATGDPPSATFTWTTPTFLDGPYMDAPTDGSTLTPGSRTGTISLAASSIASINGGQGFLSTDVGRLMRLYSQPAAWASGTAYTKGTTVFYNDVPWQAVANSTGVQPDTDNGTNWVINPTGAIWTWGTIATVVDTSHITLTLAAADPYGTLAGGPLLYTTPILVWQMGLYSETSGYPSGGCFHEGRFWLFGSQPNRMDSTMSNEDFNFAPTLLDGTVADNCGISAVFNGDDRNTIFWAAPNAQGVIVGTQAGEWLLQASNNNEVLTPTSIQAHRVTKYGCANIEPRGTGLSHVFVQRYSLAVYEYLQDVFSGKSIGTNIARKAKHLTKSGVAEIAYQQEKAPIVWARTNDGRLIGCTYRRESPFSSQPASYFGWHQHVLGSGRLVEGIQAGPSPDGNTDSLMLVTNDPATNIRYVEMMSGIPDENDTLLDANFVDAALTPAAAKVVGSDLVLYGLGYINGKTVTAWIGGIDAGDYVVSGGTVSIPLDGTANGSGGALFTTAALAAISGGTFGTLDLNITVTPPGSGFFTPVGSALDYVAAHNSSLHNNSLDQQMLFDFDALGGQGALYYGDGDNNFHGFNVTTRAEVFVESSAGAGPTNCLGYDGNLYFCNNTPLTFLQRFNPLTQTTDLTYDDTHSLPSAGYLVAIDLAGKQYVLGLGLNSGTGGGSSAPWWIVNMTDAGGPNLVSGAQGFFDEGNGSVSVGNAFPTRGPEGSAFVFVQGTLAPGYSGNPQIGFYRAAVDSPSAAGMSKIGVINPASVNAGATYVTIPGAYGMVYDETDGNVIVTLADQSSNLYLCKISTRDASVLWSNPTVATSANFRNSRIQGGVFATIVGGSNPRTLYGINTLTGAITSTTSESVIAPAGYAYSDRLGCIVVNINNIGTTDFATFGCAVGGGAITPATVYNAPAIIGFNYQSKGQILRAVLPPEGFQTGPGQGKLRRAHYAAPLMANSQYVQMGVDFGTMRQMKFKSAGGTQALPLTSLYSGVYWEAVEGGHSYDSMWCWQSSRPYPCTVVSVEIFSEGQDNA